MNVIDHSHDLLRIGRAADAVAALHRAGCEGDAGAYMELGLWRMRGLGGLRDLALCREHFHAAANLGNQEAQLIYLSFVAQGLGAPADWSTAMTLLEQAARRNAAAAREFRLIAAMSLDANGRPIALRPPKPISSAPEILLYEAFLSAREAHALIEMARPALSPSVVVDPSTGQSFPNPLRTSDDTSFPYLNETPLLHALAVRFAIASTLHVNCGEPLQVLRYLPGREYRLHFDALPGTNNQRVMTMIACLTEDFAGGETYFPANGLEWRGRVGDVIAFRNVDSLGKIDRQSRHAGLPVTAGEKIIATRWIRERPFGPR